MHITLHVGVRFAGDDVMNMFLRQNHVGLARKGWALAPTVPSEDRVSIAEIAQQCDGWLDALVAPEAGGPAQVLLSDSRLSNRLLFQGEAASMVNALKERGSVRGIGIVRRIDNYIAANYVGQLRAGRAAPLGRPELIGTGTKYICFSRLQNWLQAMGPELTVLFCAAEGPSEPLMAAIVRTLGIADLVGLTLSDATLSSPLSVDAALAMRRFNRTLLRSELPEARVQEARDAAFQSLTGISQGDEPFRLPAEVAAHLLRRFRQASEHTAANMTREDAERFLSGDVKSAPEPDRSRVATIWASLVDEFDIPSRWTGGPRKPDTTGRLRRRVMQAREARISGDTQTYERCLRQVRRLIGGEPEFMAHKAADATDHQIPDQIFQYWEPWPPPDEMLPWMSSWDTIGMSGGIHRVVSYDEGRDVVIAAAGTRGGEAFNRAPHPAARADLYRYAELILRGGWYVDAEHEALLSIPDLFTWPVEHVFVRRPGPGIVPNTFIGAVPGSGLLREVLEDACTNVIESRTANILHMTGPGVFTQRVLTYIARPEASFVILPAKVVFGGVLQLVHNQAEYKVHGHWRTHGLGPDVTLKEVRSHSDHRIPNSHPESRPLA